jgi:hypothetical protein
MEYLKKQQAKNIKKNTNNISQYKLKSNDIIIYNGNSNKNYINYNGKLMRTFNSNNIFIYLNNLSSYNYSIIKKIIDEHTSNINILINKEAYYKIKYNLYCSDDKEINIYTRKCINKCPKNYQRNFYDRNFKCTRKNIKYTILDDKNKKNKIIDNKIIDNKNINYKNINYKNINYKNMNYKNKKNKIIDNKNKKTKKCPSNYEINPFTKACTSKCPSGYIRNLKFNCISKKDVL